MNRINITFNEETDLEEVSWRIRYLAEAGARIVIDAAGEIDQVPGDAPGQLQALFETIADLARPLNYRLDEINRKNEGGAA